ncbi:MAG: DUF1573 domain-containing protein [Bacteroidetes bacterium]|nr:DUF1573 domain-containing protein [Bacteroidota bacterium]
MDKMEHNYGNIKQGDNGECTFKFTNTGKEPLVITSCMGSCGCTVPKCPAEPVLPGKTAEIHVKYDTNRVGGIYKTVTVNSNNKNGVVTLTIKGNVEAKPVEESFPQNKASQGAPTEKKS